MTLTQNLQIPLLDGSDPFRKETYNDIFNEIDKKALAATHKMSKAHFELWQPNTAYKKQDVVRTESCPNWGFYMCTTAGTSGDTEPQGYGEGDILTDGTCQWTLKLFGGATLIKHQSLVGRNSPNQHTIAAITDLQELLDKTASKDELQKAIDDLINGAPGALDTLKEIADALADDDSAIAAIIAALANKVDKEVGKGLSSNDYTDVDKGKVDLITVTKAIDLDNIGSNLHNHTNKDSLDKIGETNGRLTYNGISITGGAGEWRANHSYVLDELVVSENLLYRCITAHTSGSAFDKTNWQQITIGYIPNWQSGKQYIVDMVVIEGRSILRCITAHTSSVYASDKVNWEVIASKGSLLKDWQINSSYDKDEIVFHQGFLYRAKTAQETQPAFEADHWQRLAAGYIPEWSSGNEYVKDMVVSCNKALYRCLNNHTAMQFKQDKHYWTAITAAGGIQDWQVYTDYEIKELVVYNKKIYACKKVHQSQGIFEPEYWESLSGQGTGLTQITLLGVTAPETQDIAIHYTDEFNLPPIEVLKFNPNGQKDQLIPICSFNEADSNKFLVGGAGAQRSEQLIFSEGLKINNNYEAYIREVEYVDSTILCETGFIDFNDYKKVEEIRGVY